MPDDVIPADSSPADTTPPEEGTAPVAVQTAPVDDRPVQNVVAEFNRKFQRMQEQNQAQFQALAQMIQGGGRHVEPQKGPASDEELWSLAQQGDRSAFELYQERIAERKFNQLSGRQNMENMVDAQLGVLQQRYPGLNDPSHPLAQLTAAVYQSMLQRGYQNGKASLLDAVKTAIADRPDLAAEYVRPSQAQASARQSASQRAASGQMGASHRDGAPTATANVKVSSGQAEIAKRMGIKDPAKAIARFKERQASGVSNIGAVASHITEEI